MTETFPTAVIGSIYSGYLLCGDFSMVHEAIEKLAGGPVWTHQLPRICDELKPHITAHCPEIAAFDYSGVNEENFCEYRDRLVQTRGEAVKVQCPLLTGHEPNPFRDLPDPNGSGPAIIPILVGGENDDR